MAKAPAPPRQPRFPRRDADGRIATLPDMITGLVFALVVCMIILFAIDALFTLLGRGDFGSFSGWIGGILAVWMFAEDFRAWKGVPLRALAALAGVIIGLGVGVGVNAALSSEPLALSGALSVTVATLLYAVVWYFGIRYLASRFGER